MKKPDKLKKWRHLFLCSIVACMVFTSCDDGKVNLQVEDLSNRKPSDQNKPVVFNRFEPESGRVATQMLIYGENFGGIKENIHVIVNGKQATVIGVNEEGTMVYCIIPTLRDATPRTEGEKISVNVQVQIGDRDVLTADKLFDYTFSQNVSTFLGFTDQDGKTAIVDGGPDKAQFQSPFWLSFDRDKNLYLIEENQGLRFVKMHTVRDSIDVSTVFRTGDGLYRPRTITYRLDKGVPHTIGDTMIISVDGNEWDWVGTVILVRDPVSGYFKAPWKSVMNHKQCNGGAVHPVSGEYWFNSYNKSQVVKVLDWSSIPWKNGATGSMAAAAGTNQNGSEFSSYYFLVQDNSWEFNIQIAPSGDFAYIVSKNQHYIARMNYNYTQKAFEKPTPFVGSQKRWGYKDGVGLNTLFHEPQQGAFKGGDGPDKDDFYVCDGENHCIRLVTPQGQVSTFAGRAENAGYSDGALRDAQFDSPFGMAYDADIQTFYIADRDNCRIRTITIE